jgi:hypothetical protein
MTLLTRHESELKTNAYWVDLMQYTSLGDVLAPSKKISCISDLPAMYEAASVEDLYEVFQQLGLGDGEIFTCVTVAGKEDPALATDAGEVKGAGAQAAVGVGAGEGAGALDTAVAAMAAFAGAGAQSKNAGGGAAGAAAAAAAASLGMAMSGGIAEALKSMGKQAGGASAGQGQSEGPDEGPDSGPKQ